MRQRALKPISPAGVIVNDVDKLGNNQNVTLTEQYTFADVGSALILEHDRAFPTVTRLALYVAGSVALFLAGVGSAVGYQGDGGDHRIGHANRPSYPLQVAGDPAGQFGGRLIKRDDSFGGDRRQEGLQAAVALLLLETMNDLNQRDGGERVSPKGSAVSGAVSDDGLIDALAEFGQRIGVEEELIQRR